MEPSEVPKAVFEKIAKEYGAGTEICEEKIGSRMWWLVELEQGGWIGLCEEGKKSREYFSGYESVRFTIWRFKPGEDDLLSHVFEVVAKGFDASEWGYGFGRTKIEDARAFFSFSRGISASDRLLEVIVLALTHFATLDAERKKYTEKDIDPAGDYTEPPD